MKRAAHINIFVIFLVIFTDKSSKSANLDCLILCNFVRRFKVQTTTLTII